MDHLPPCALHMDHSKNLSALTSEVLRVMLQALKLPVVGFKGQLLSHLKRALLGNSAVSTAKGAKQDIPNSWLKPKHTAGACPPRRIA